MVQHLLIGYGPAATATARMLAERDEPVRVISRSPRREEPGIEHIVLDATSADQLSAAAKDAEVIYNCASPPYHQWKRDWPALSDAVNAAARASGAVLVGLSNLYGYGEVTGAMHEDLPLNAQTDKGKVRAQVWEKTRALHDKGDIRAVEVRASDFFGPLVTTGGHLASRVMPPLLRGKPVQVMGDPDSPHSWTYLPDVARTLIRAGAEPGTLGRAWHVPTAPALSARAMIERLAATAGVGKVSVRPIPPVLLRASSLFSPLIRELREIRYQFDRPFVMDSSAFTDRFDEQPTALEEQIAATVSWWKATS